MSSIPLSRILAAKKTNGELEKEQFDKQMVNIVQFCFYIYSGFLLLVFAYFSLFSLFVLHKLKIQCDFRAIELSPPTSIIIRFMYTKKQNSPQSEHSHARLNLYLQCEPL